MKTVFYGKSLLELITHGYEGKGGKAKIVRAGVHWNSDDPEKLAAACPAVKGHHDWEK